MTDRFDYSLTLLLKCLSKEMKRFYNNLHSFKFKVIKIFGKCLTFREFKLQFIH